LWLQRNFIFSGPFIIPGVSKIPPPKTGGGDFKGFVMYSDPDVSFSRCLI